MVLIRDNCFLYNPVGDRIRKDCQHMFDHYIQLYEKLTGKVHKVGKNERVSFLPIGRFLPPALAEEVMFSVPRVCPCVRLSVCLRSRS